MSALAPTVCAAMALCICRVAAAEQPSPPAPASAVAAQPPTAVPASAADERLVLSGAGSTLSGDHGGGGGSVTWLRNIDSGGVIGAGAEYETIANSHWTVGAVSGSLTFGQARKTSLYADAHEGAGDIGEHAFHYSILVGGVISTLAPWLSLQLEERRIDIDKSHGNLPKLGLSFRVSQPLLASVSYAQSFGGNLGSKLGAARLDYVGKRFSWLAGAAYGPATSAVLNLLTQVVSPGGRLKEGFAGVGRSLGRTDWQLLGDYQDLAGTKRTTITLTCTVHLGARGQAP
jgi:hypothetical protein